MAERLTGAEQHREIESHITSWLNGQDCPGVSVTIVDGDETVFTGAYGDRQLDPQKPVTKETLFAIGSSTKPITATAVMTLVDDGTVGLDDPVSDYVP
jgi:putative ATP-binding cassette transporter